MFLSRALRNAFPILLTFFLTGQIANALTITDENHVVYDVINGTHNVTISASNNGLAVFQQTNVDLVIPEKVVDTSSSASSTDNVYTVVGMSPQAFKNCTGLISIDIQAPIPSVPSQAFDGCTKLTTVKLPDTVKSIAYRAFFGCSSLTSITGFSELQTIDSYAFQECSSLTSFDLPQTVTSIGSYCFYKCSSLESLTFPDGITTLPTYLCSYCSSLKTVELPSALTKIGTEAFRYCDALQMPELPTTLTTMEYRVFANCGNLGKVKLVAGVNMYEECFLNSCLTDVEFPSEKVELGSRCFMNTTGLKKVILPNWLHKPELSWQGWFNTIFDSSSDLEEVEMEVGITELGSSWFANCKKLTKVTCVSTLKEIQSSCFNNCTALSTISLPAEMELIGTTAFKGCTSLTSVDIPKGVSIYDNAFNGSGLENINFPHASLGEVSSTAFYHLPNVKTLTIPGEIDNLPNSIFSYFEGLESVILEEGITKIPDGMFQFCKNLNSITLPSSLETIGLDAFGADWRNPSSLTSIIFPEGLREIKAGAFYQSALKEVEFPSTLERLGYDSQTGVGTQTVFGNSVSLRKVTFKGCKVIGHCAFNPCTALTEIEFPDNLEVIGSLAFSGCDALSEITIPDGVQKVGDKAFSAKGITTVTLSAGTEFGNEVFTKCESLTTINFPETACSFGSHVFGECGKLKTVTLPDWMETVPREMFFNCGLLENLTFGKNIKKIGSNAFYNCFLSQLTLPETIQEIGANAFQKIKANAITLPAGCKIGDNAFAETYLRTITFPETEDPEKYDDVAITFGRDVFRYTSVSSIELPAWMTVVPVGLFNNSDLAHVEFKGAVTEIGDDAFRTCTKLTNVEFPSTLRRIGKYAFYYCGTSRSDMVFGPVTITGEVDIDDHAFDYARITEITFGDCAELGEGCLANQTKISSITFPDCMDEIPAEFCSGWTELTSVTLSDQTKRLGDKVFYDCQKLTEIVLPESVEYIGSEAFNRTAIKEITLPDHHVELAEKALMSADIQISWNYIQPSALELVKMSRKQRSIPANCFYTNNSMKALEWYGDLEDTTQDGEVPSLSVGSNAFYKCGSLEKIEFPDENLTVAPNAFQLCTSAKSIIWPGNDKEISLSNNVFEECTALEAVTLPDLLAEVPNYCFWKCRNLADLTLGRNITRVGENAFATTGIETIKWNNLISSIDKAAFYDAKIKELELPQTVTFLGDNAFADNTRQMEVEEDSQTITKTVGTIEQFRLNTTLTQIPGYCFQNSISAEEITIPANIRIIGNMAFQNCGEKKLTFETAADGTGVEYIYQAVFQNNKNLEYFEIPPTLKSQEMLGHMGMNVLTGCTSLKKIVNKLENFKARNGSFSDCTSLEEFQSDLRVERFGDGCFSGCTSLTTIDIPQDYTYNIYNNSWEGVGYGDNCFENCVSLTDDSFFRTTKSENKYIFKNCTGFKEFTMPDSISSTPRGILYGASNLQSITWTFKGDKFQFYPEDISGAPLEALSFSRSAEVRMPLSIDRYPYALPTYSPDDRYPTTSPERSILMVERGERWKYVKMGYDQVFDIREMREPRIDLQGDIRSSFNSIVDDDGKITILNDNKNHYKANLRWHMPLSDFNTAAPTVVKIFRDDTCIGRVVFSIPQVLEKANEGTDWKYPDVDKIYRVTISYDNPDNYSDYIDHSIFTGDFTSSTDVKNLYRMEYIYQEEQMDFDFNTHQRLLDYDHNGFKSWFAFCDKFVSPELDDPTMPATYTYHAEMQGFPYDTLVNNPDFEEIDGKRYSTLTKNREETPFISNDVLLYSAIALPKVHFDGLVSLADIQQDKMKGMKHIDISRNNIENLKVGYIVDEAILLHDYEYLEKNESGKVIKKLLLYEMDADGNLREVGSNDLSSRSKEGDFTTAPNYRFEPGQRYVLVTESPSRGDFGSAAITIPGVPTITPETSDPVKTGHFNDPDSEKHQNVGYKVSIKSNLDVSKMGFDAEHPLTASDYYIGLMRRHTSPMLRAQSAEEWSVDDDDTDLIHHYDGRQTECDAEVCPVCASEIGRNIEHDAEGGPIYNDHVEVPYGSAANLEYNMRVYVKVPDQMLRTAEPTYMLAEATTATSAAVVTGIENVTVDSENNGFNIADFDESELRYFDLQGRQIARPAAGTPCIIVTPAGSVKAVMK